jgi:thymidylate kinase
MRKGKFIVVYGANNLGKTTQVSMLAEALRRSATRIVTIIKYPIYDLEPTGPKLNSILRKGEKVDDLTVQKLFAKNRRDFEKELKRMLRLGHWVIAEDYKGTGIAWGVTRGIPLEEMEKINRNLLPEDFAILLDGKRYKSAIETGHMNEGSEKIWKKARQVHQMLGERYGWLKVNANQRMKEVHRDVMKKIVGGLTDFELTLFDYQYLVGEGILR